MNKPPAGFQRPFKADKLGCYIWDAQGCMAADIHNKSLRARGWGRIQYLDNPNTLMDEWTAWVTQKTQDAINLSDAIRLLNEI